MESSFAPCTPRVVHKTGDVEGTARFGRLFCCCLHLTKVRHARSKELNLIAEEVKQITVSDKLTDQSGAPKRSRYATIVCHAAMEPLPLHTE
jgi:hypothetical protein